jgi:hypothetical protein
VTIELFLTVQTLGIWKILAPSMGWDRQGGQIPILLGVFIRSRKAVHGVKTIH